MKINQGRHMIKKNGKTNLLLMLIFFGKMTNKLPMIISNAIKNYQNKVK